MEEWRTKALGIQSQKFSEIENDKGCEIEVQELEEHVVRVAGRNSEVLLRRYEDLSDKLSSRTLVKIGYRLKTYPIEFQNERGMKLRFYGLWTIINSL